MSRIGARPGGQDVIQPLVSIILPTRNRSALLRRAVESVRRQSCAAWELLIVDDGSTDDTPRLTEELSADPRVRTIRQAEPVGASAARNRGIAQAGATRYLAFLDDDDEWLPEKLEKQVHLLESNPDAVVAGCGRVTITPRRELNVVPRTRQNLFVGILTRTSVGSGTPLIVVRRVGAVATIRFDEAMSCLEDAEYLLRICRATTSEAVFVPEPLVIVHRESGGHLASPENAVRAYRRLLGRYRDDIRAMPNLEAMYWIWIAGEYASMGRADHVRQAVGEACALRSQGDWRFGVWRALARLGPRAFCAARRGVPLRYRARG